MTSNKRPNVSIGAETKKKSVAGRLGKEYIFFGKGFLEFLALKHRRGVGG
jgi:hypothetical protein